MEKATDYETSLKFIVDPIQVIPLPIQAKDKLLEFP
jgi:hypothetical protein